MQLSLKPFLNISSWQDVNLVSLFILTFCSGLPSLPGDPSQFFKSLNELPTLWNFLVSSLFLYLSSHVSFHSALSLFCCTVLHCFYVNMSFSLNMLQGRRLHLPRCLACCVHYNSRKEYKASLYSESEKWKSLSHVRLLQPLGPSRPEYWSG